MTGSCVKYDSGRNFFGSLRGAPRCCFMVLIFHVFNPPESGVFTGFQWDTALGSALKTGEATHRAWS